MTIITAAGASRFIRHGHACLGVAGPAGLILTAGGHNDSLLWSRNLASGNGQLHTLSPWGNGNTTDGLPGFNGQRADPVSGSYHLGNGYRAYNPVLRRFNCPDSLSPFGVGGINPYAYCAGDPINHTDPTGHISWQGIVGIIGGVIGVGLGVFTAGASIAAAGGVAAAVNSTSITALVVGSLGIVADVTGIASGATEDVDPQASSVLGWISITAGLTGMAAGAALAPKGVKALKKWNRSQLKIDLNPGGASGLRYYKSSSLQAIPRNGKIVDNTIIGFAHNIAGTGEPGIILHGNTGGAVLTEHRWQVLDEKTNFAEPPSYLASEKMVVDYFKKRGVDLFTIAQDKPLHYLSCRSGGVDGRAQKLADYLGRTVIAYGNENDLIRLRPRFLLQDKVMITSGPSDALFQLKPVSYYPRNASDI